MYEYATRILFASLCFDVISSLCNTSNLSPLIKLVDEKVINANILDICC